MRRESSTVVVLIGETGEGMLAGLARSPNVSVARAPAQDSGDSTEPDPARPGWEPGALAMRSAARLRSTYVVVANDPLADVAARWQAMWELPGGPDTAASFEERAAEVLAAWRSKQFELPDYYLVTAPALPEAAAPDLYLGPLRAVRPRRIAVAPFTETPAEPAQIMRALRELEHGPWWPPLDELLDAARRFYPGAITDAQSAASRL
ncbi:MAG: hypothetical protein ACTHJW_10735 [Streptosporangiaceae bacterium]